jgi:hypothetical protein
MFQTSVQEEVKIDLWSILGGAATFALLIAGGYFLILA